MNELPPPIVVKVKSMQGPMLDIICNPYSTVAQFKVLIEEKSQVSPDNQRLIYLGKVLKDTFTLESYGT
jgi:ubiquilin